MPHTTGKYASLTFCIICHFTIFGSFFWRSQLLCALRTCPHCNVAVSRQINYSWLRFHLNIPFRRLRRLRNSFARYSCRICVHVERRLQPFLDSSVGFSFFAMECWSTYYSESLGPVPSASYGTTAPLAPGLGVFFFFGTTFDLVSALSTNCACAGGVKVE